MVRTSGKVKKVKKSVGRQPIYHSDFDEQAYRLCLLGLTDAELASFFSVSETTINKWKKAHRSFANALRRGKVMADGEVAQGLYARAIGYAHDDVHVSSYQGVVTLTPIVKYYPPDTAAATFWLKNRQPDKWRDKVQQEVTGAGGGPLVVSWGCMPPRAIDEGGHSVSD